MDCAAVLRKSRSSIVDESYAVVEGSHTQHYETAGEVITRERLEGLFDLVVTAIGNRDLSGVSTYAETVATERFGQGFDIGEVQAAFNALEASMWRRIVASAAPDELAEATGLLSTVLGFGKDVLARTYVSLASQRHVRSLNLSAMFAGTQARPAVE
ncbi:hypothetical protein BA895_04445 [Humibacillus sp. DSM 29435]|uniref:hypothetical protein n=1 Tax=Humibacillus sp. DSM 29435 TaxID=1869167 RepID=UPI000872EB6D|nr:hypothetical protein [Humibacillus sp. DSM 29435]OFE16810.1 hypothetical protein BA895_04445 [Humibacillus sp. DSM 29435]